jgi:fatty-acyl-CoA synthase
VTVNPALRPRELAYVLGQSRADGIFLVPAYRASRMAEMAEQVRSELPAPRGDLVRRLGCVLRRGRAGPGAAGGEPALGGADPVHLRHHWLPQGRRAAPPGIVNNVRLCTTRLGLAPGNVQLSGMPLFHTAGCVLAVLGAVVTCGTLILPPYFDPGLMLELIAAERPDTVAGVPTMLIGMLDHRGFAATGVSPVRRLLAGGAVVPPSWSAAWRLRSARRYQSCSRRPRRPPVITQISPQDTAEDPGAHPGTPAAADSGQNRAPELVSGRL